jgi:hypothetical protein
LPHFLADLLHFSAAIELSYFRQEQNSPFSGVVSTIDRALHFQRRPISARLKFLLKEALQR